MRRGHPIARHQVLVIGSCLNANVLFAQQPAGEDFQRAVFGESVALLQGEGHAGLVAFVIELDGGDAAHHDAGALDRRLWLQSADVVELGRDAVGGLKAQAEQIGRLQRQKQNGRGADQHQQADPHIIFGALHVACPFHKLNISAVRMKSRPNTDSEATTTVRVVARDTPSGVACAS